METARSKPKEVALIILMSLLCLIVTVAISWGRLLVGFFALVLVATDFNPTGDWEYTDLPGGYWIGRGNSSDIDLCMSHNIITSDGCTNIRVPTYISSFCSNDRYIAVRWIDISNMALESYDSAYVTETIRARCDEAAWYLVDTADDALYGPYDTEAAFEAVCAEQGVGELGPWIDTVPRPEGSK